MNRALFLDMMHAGANSWENLANFAYARALDAPMFSFSQLAWAKAANFCVRRAVEIDDVVYELEYDA